MADRADPAAAPLAAQFPDFAPRLIAWQRQRGRHDLPWQQTRDAYRVWLAEIMLQQTQVGTVIPYYRRFLDRFPDLAALAAASQAEVLAGWAGLGYYARARNLHRCARAVAGEHGGRFPTSAGSIAELPGIGRSTAAAIAAFAFGERAAILDGNVKRVLARVFGVAGYPGEKAVERRLWALAESLLPVAGTGGGIEAYTQGLMDLGATVCTRRQPACADCPFAGSCVAAAAGRQHELPAARPARAVPEREATVSVFTDGRRVLLERRPPTGIWGGLLALPEGRPEALAAHLGLAAHVDLSGGSEPLPLIRHRFTHFRLTLHPWRCTVAAGAPAAAESGREWLDLDQLPSAALPAPIRKLLASLTNHP